jgi:hypothetical protein
MIHHIHIVVFHVGRDAYIILLHDGGDDEFELHYGQAFTNASTATFAEGHEHCVPFTALFFRFEPSRGVEDIRVGEDVRVALGRVALC